MKKWQIVLGIVLIVLGLFSLTETLFNINLGRFIGPLFLVGLGLFLILRPRREKGGVQVEMPILGDIRKTGAWEVTQHEFWWFVGENRLDFSAAAFPQGDGMIKIFGFVTDVKIILPADVGLQIESAAFVSELKLPEGKKERFLSRLNYQSPNFLQAEKRVSIETVGFVSEIVVRPPIVR
jgi:predicted membrane protein